MSYIDHDRGPEVTGPARPVTAQRTPSGGEHPLLDLQRQAGNAAVNSAIKSGRFGSTQPVQRLADETESSQPQVQTEAMEEEQEEEEQTE